MRSMAAILVTLWLAPPAHAHPLAPRLLELSELESGVVQMTWTVPAQQQAGAALRPLPPTGCIAQHPLPDTSTGDQSVRYIWTLGCDRLATDLAPVVTGLRKSGLMVIARVTARDGTTRERLLTGDSSEWTDEPVVESGNLWTIFRQGAAHLLGGLDHVLIIIGLTWLLGPTRKLLIAILSFTMGHAISMAATATDVLRIPELTGEAMIALTIIALAVEIGRQDRHRFQQYTWSLPLIIGAIHGFGFASAFSGIGLVGTDLATSLLAFNLGLEAAQLMIAAPTAALMVIHARRNLKAPRALATGLEILAGGLGFYWLGKAVF